MKNDSKIEVISATVLSESQVSELEESLKRIFSISDLTLDFSVDTGLIAGVIIKNGSKVIDLSLDGKLGEIKNYILNG
jgi:F-type H+-transporting ATPase subunit delta